MDRKAGTSIQVKLFTRPEDLYFFLLEYLNNLVYAAAVDIAVELLQRVQNPWSSKFLAFFGAPVNPSIVGPKLVCQWKANI
jgi:hypothetical protein